MKVLWQKRATCAAAAEEVSFPVGVCRAVRRALECSQTLLPQSSRRFKEWQVGLLCRFDTINAST